MKRLFILPACLLLLWTFTAFVSAQAGKGEGDKKDEIEVINLGANIRLKCAGIDNKIQKTVEEEGNQTLELQYKDENSGEYSCFSSSSPVAVQSIYVKFRTCDNCIELDVAAIVGLAVGDLVATAVIGVAVYLIASQAGVRPSASPQNKGSDRQHLVPNEMTGRLPNEHYERLRHKGQKETYDVINKR